MHGTFHQSNAIEPAILYFGTPVVLIGSSNEDGSANLAPMSSAWWVGWRCMLGLASNSRTTENMIRSGECVLNLPSADLVDAVNRLARTTGSNPVPPGKVMRGSFNPIVAESYFPMVIFKHVFLTPMRNTLAMFTIFLATLLEHSFFHF